MKTPELKNSYLEAGLCRCCGSTSLKCKILTQEYEIYGEKEVFVDMLRNAFGIELSHLDHKEDRLVCTGCVGRLRGALTFKMLVLNTEQDFCAKRSGACYDVQKSASKLDALELVEAELLNMDDYVDLNLDNMPDGLDDELTPELLLEYEQLELMNLELQNTLAAGIKEAAKRKYVCKQSAPSKTQDELGFCSSDDDFLSNLKESLDKQNKFKTRKLRTGKKKGQTTKEINLKRDANLKTIIKHSYVCPFKCRYNHIICYYCDKNFIDPTLLREHTLTHDPGTFKPSRINRNTKVDIQRIDCRLCPERITDLTDFKRHLVATHGVKFYVNCKDWVLPFVLQKDANNCAICGDKFPSFHLLNKHMNVHFSNFVCETCGLGFMEETALSKHKRVHLAKCYSCKYCGRTFKAKTGKVWHIRTVHKKVAGTTCKLCGKYMLLHEKKQHILEAHGGSPAEPCFACDKVFKTRRLLTYHLRRDHMKAYKHECQMCDRKFYTGAALKIHMPTHTGARDYRCRVCGKCYPRVKTLRQHMRIHNNDRRYKCIICGQAFVQNCSLKGHMKSKHPEYAQS